MVSKYIWSLFNFIAISPLQSVGLGKILHISADYVGKLRKFSFIFENTPFPCIIAIFLNKILFEIKILSTHLRISNSLGAGCNLVILHTA